jgi:tripartite-type tricarboxylate transporter receptor subunit TctC
MAEVGLRDFNVEVLTGLFAPAGAPAALISDLNKRVREILQNPEVKRKFFESGVETRGGNSDEFRALVREEIDKWAPLIKAQNIRA